MYIAMAYFHASQQIANIGEVKRVIKQKRFFVPYIPNVSVAEVQYGPTNRIGPHGSSVVFSLVHILNVVYTAN